MKINQHIIGGVQIKSSLSIEELGYLLSKNILGGIPLIGLEKNIYEEVPAISNELLGFTVVLQGYSGLDNETGFWFDLVPNFTSSGEQHHSIDLSIYFVDLFRHSFKGRSDIKIVEVEKHI